MTAEPFAPLFYLYGEPHRAAAADFLHVERLADRSRPSEWTIRPHAHADLDQLFFIDEGGGTMIADDNSVRFAAPVMLVMPANAVHGFDWESESAGWVLTLSRPHGDALARRHPELASVFAQTAALSIDPGSVGAMRLTLEVLARELAWIAPAHDAAVEGALLTLLSGVLRLLGTGRGAAAGTTRAAHLVARFRARLEERFRLRESMGSYADALGVSETRLRDACARVAGRSPTAMIDQRCLLEARRALLYSSLSVAEIGYALGFEDPAYFSRFFTRHVGCSPRAFRRAPRTDR